MTTRHLNACIVGAGPRGVSVLERLCANARGLPPQWGVTVHVVEPHRPGAGGVWRTDQSRHLLMNTVASQVTLFTDESVDIEGVRASGPSLYEWAKRLGVEQPVEYEAGVLAEARELGPDSYPTRAFYGHYLEWAFRHVVETAPKQVRIRVHQARAVRLDDGADGGQDVTLDSGLRLTGLDAVALAQGHVPADLTLEEHELTRFADRHGLVYVAPANPADVDLSAVGPWETVLLRGLGLNFFDYMALLTLGRGGVFTRRDGLLVYEPSGREPLLYAGSRRGLPYHSRGRNQKGAHGRHEPLVLTPDVLNDLRLESARRPGLDFRRDLWPLIAKEVETVYYTALLAKTLDDSEVERFRKHYLEVPWGADQERELLDEAGVPGEARWSWRRVTHPYEDRVFSDGAEYRNWLLDMLRQDLRAAQEGNVDGPLKAALDVLRDLRNEIRLVVDHGGLTGPSHRDDLERWYTPLNAFLSIGPPASRIEEMIALIEAGVLELLGPGLQVTTGDGVFIAECAVVSGIRVRARALIEARLPVPDVRRSADPLLRHLLGSGQSRAYVVGCLTPEPYETGGLAVAQRPYRVIDATGREHPTLFAYGITTESVHWVTAAGIRPGVNSVTLGDSDAIALAMLDLLHTVPEAEPDRWSTVSR
ncbi:FAD/NAD(P)-binding protein [Streptomyces sp. NPDC054933]